LNPHNAAGWTNHGLTLFKLGHLQEALAAHEKAIELSPRYGSAHANRAEILAWLGRCDEAATELHRAEELSPLNPVNRNNIASVHLWPLFYNCPGHSDLDEAMRHARFAYESQPRLRLGLASALFRKGEYRDAKRIGREIYEVDPEFSMFFGGYTLAMCHWQLGEKTEARRLFDELVAWQEKRLPDNPSLKRQHLEAAGLLGIQP